MGWWKALKEQFNESWQELLYTLELTIAGADDLPWLDTLNFFWDSLPDADKLTTAERRRLAHSVKLLVRQAVQDHYDKEVSQKHAILMRQIRRHQAQAEQHIQQLAEKRQAQLQALSETARQQSMGLPPASELDVLLEGLDDVDQQQLKQLTTEQYRQYLQHLQQEVQRHRSSPQAPPAAITSSTVEAVGTESVAVGLLVAAGEIQPATPASSSSGSRCSSPGRGSQSHQLEHVQQPEMQQPLLEASYDSNEGNQGRLEAWEPGQHQQLGSYHAPALNLPQAGAPEAQKQAEEVVIDIKPLHSRILLHSGSQLMLQRYLDASQPSVAVVHCAAAPDKQQQRQEAADGGVLQPTMSDVSSDGAVVRTMSDSSSMADHSIVGPRISTSSSTVVTPVSTYSSRAAIDCLSGSKFLDGREAACRSPADTVVNVDQLLRAVGTGRHHN